MVVAEESCVAQHFSLPRVAGLRGGAQCCSVCSRFWMQHFRRPTVQHGMPTTPGQHSTTACHAGAQNKEPN